MEKAIITVLEHLKEPILVLLFAIICGLFYLLQKKDKHHYSAYTGLSGDIKRYNENLNDCNVTMAKIVTLVEVLVHGRK